MPDTIYSYDVILSGPVNAPDCNREEFRRVQLQVSLMLAAKHRRAPTVWNPSVLPEGHTAQWYVDVCGRKITRSPKAVVVMLNGWRRCERALAEFAIARVCGNKIVFEKDGINL